MANLFSSSYVRPATFWAMKYTDQGTLRYLAVNVWGHCV
jgi:hypothetical protein